MYVRNKGSVANLDQNALRCGRLLCPVYGDLSHREPTVFKLDWYSAVTRAVSHLNEDLATGLNEFIQAGKNSETAFLLLAFLSAACDDAGRCYVSSRDGGLCVPRI